MPATVYLVPFGSAGMYEQEVSIQIHPPKSPEAESRMWDLEISAYSKAHEAEAGAVPAQMFIHPYEDYDAKIKPERRKSRRKAHYDVEVENKSNATATIWLSASDPDLALRYRFRKPYVKVKPGEKIQAVIDVKPHKKLWLGRATERRFELGTHLKDKDEKPDEVARMEELSAKRKRGGVKGLARSGASKAGVSGPRLNKGGLNVGPQGLQMRGPQVYKGNVSGKQVNFDNLSKLPGFKRQQGMKMPVGPLMPRQAAFVQKPFLPWWIALIIPLLILIGIILWLLWPRNITVPDVRPQADVRAAEKILKDKKLRLDKTDKKVVTDKAQIGKILDQAPSPGKKVKENTGVTVIVGVGNGKVEVPDLKGKTIKDVSTLLPKQKLEIGAIKPQDEDQEFIVRSQLPLAGQFVREGTPVNINVIKPPVKKKPSGGGDEEESAAEAKAAADAAAAAAAKGEGPADITVPAIDGKNDEQYANLLGDAKLAGSIKRIFNPLPENRVISTSPEPGTKVAENAEVVVFVSAGIPQIAYDNETTNNGDVLRIDGANGKSLEPITKNADREENAAWNFDATKLVWVAGDSDRSQLMRRRRRQARQGVTSS